MTRIQLHPAYVIHRRSYRETSFLIELFTHEYGRISLVARGARKTFAQQGLLQPFVPLLVSWTGTRELKNLTHVELHGSSKRLTGDGLFAGLYLNELLNCLTHKDDPLPILYQLYEETLNTLQAEGLQEKTLRRFEKKLLQILGYGILVENDYAQQMMIVPHRYYRFCVEEGFVGIDESPETFDESELFLGKHLLAIANEDWQDNESMRDAKRLTRFVLQPLLGSRPIYSRALFAKRKIKEEEKKNDT